MGMMGWGRVPMAPIVPILPIVPMVLMASMISPFRRKDKKKKRKIKIIYRKNRLFITNGGIFRMKIVAKLNMSEKSGQRKQERSCSYYDVAQAVGGSSEVAGSGGNHVSALQLLQCYSSKKGIEKSQK